MLVIGSPGENSPALVRAPNPAERALAGIARLLADPAQTGSLLERHAPGSTLDWLHVDE